MTSVSGERRTKLLSNRQVAEYLKEFKHCDKLQRYTKVYRDLLSGKVVRKDQFKSYLEQLLPVFPEKLIPSVWLTPETFDILKFPKWIPHADPSIRKDSRTLFAALQNNYNLFQYCDRECFIRHQKEINDVIKRDLMNKTISCASSESKDIIGRRWGFILYYIPENCQTIGMHETVARNTSAEEVMNVLPQCLRNERNMFRLAEINPHIVLYSVRNFPVETYMKIPFLNLAICYSIDKNEITERILTKWDCIFENSNYREAIRRQYHENLSASVSHLPAKFISVIYEADANAIGEFSSEGKKSLIPIIADNKLMALKFDYSMIQTCLKYVKPEFVTTETSLAIIDRLNGFSRSKDARLNDIYHRYPIIPEEEDELFVYNHLGYACKNIRDRIYNIIYNLIRCFPKEMFKMETLTPEYLRSYNGKELNLSSRKLSLDHIKALASNTSIRILKLLQNRIDDEGAKILATNTTLTNLNLSTNRIGDEGAKALAANTTLRTLDLMGNQVRVEGAKALAANKTLKTLNLSLNQIGIKGIEALATNKTLRILDLSRNGIGDKGAGVLAANKTLRILYLGDNEIGDEGAKALGANTTLRALNLSDNQIGDRGAKSLAVGRAGTTLRTLDLMGNQVRVEGAKALATNTSLRILNLSWNQIGDKGAKALSNNITLRILNGYPRKYPRENNPIDSIINRNIRKLFWSF